MNFLKSHKLKLLFYLQLVLAITSSSIHSQDIESVKVDGVLDKLINDYSKSDALKRDILYLHLNKNVLIEGERVWFTAYNYNLQDETLSNHNSNLYCGLYDVDGKQLEKKLFFMDNGIASGYFDLKKDYGNQIFMKAYVGNPDKNGFENNFVQQIDIISTEFKEDSSRKTVSDYEIQLGAGPQPNQGLTTIPFRTLDSAGKGIRLNRGSLVTNKGDTIISNVGTNDYGVGTLNFFATSGLEYKLLFDIPNDSILSERITLNKSNRPVLSVNVASKTHLNVQISPGVKLSENQSETYILAVHNNGKIKPLTVEIDTTPKNLKLKWDDLFEGANVLSLFDSNRSLVDERVVFNYRKPKSLKVKAKILDEHKSKDSVSVELVMEDTDFHLAQISISILPSNFKSFQKRTLLTDLWVNPYINFTLYDGDEMLLDTTRTSHMRLNTMLQFNGNSQYDWTEIFNHKKTNQQPSSKGVSVLAKVKRSNGKAKKLLLVDKLRNEQYVSYITATDSIQFNEVILFKDTPISAYLFNHENKLIGSSVELKATSSIEIDSFQPMLIKPQMLRGHELIFADKTMGYDLSETTVMLDEVELESEQKKRFKVDLYGMTVMDITEENITLSGFIRKLGLRILFNKEDLLYYVSRRKTLVPVVIDGFTEIGFRDTNLVNFKEIRYRTDQRPVIFLTTKKKQNSYHNDLQLETGFEKPTAYDNSEKFALDPELWAEYGAIFWIPQQILRVDEPTIIKLPKTIHDRVLISIQGVTDNGLLISSEKIISLE